MRIYNVLHLLEVAYDRTARYTRRDHEKDGVKSRDVGEVEAAVVVFHREVAGEIENGRDGLYAGRDLSFSLNIVSGDKDLVEKIDGEAWRAQSLPQRIPKRKETAKAG